MPKAPHTHLSAVDHVREHLADETERLSCRVQEGTDRVLLHLSGELDLLGAPKAARVFRECLNTSSGTVVCDLAGLDFLATSGLRVLLEVNEQARARQQELVLLTGGASAEVLRLLEITDTRSMLTCRADLEETDTPVVAAP
ncbi:anti-anti-sigma factor [Halopolyspora algeriensis]|uniref:Anti-sigma factor antagonist n=1 Tax=Halopolyspora algeriensis TaxID=1500506 RepID=A0A368VFK7_9ACTN|nr:STAS domain-containing protein [Halopolyspora algeriensis]RCW40003.1 anti-anti-sigma factor [Halopolyspora algeriensis]TQM46559.1 anti-anti-sigma factor [Halopolyspora algeriensis]